AHVEQKNGAVVRPLVGYDRFASRAAYAQLARIYALAHLHVNFFQPVEKLVSKHRTGARLHRVFDRPQTPLSETVCQWRVTRGNAAGPRGPLPTPPSTAAATRARCRAGAPVDPGRPRPATRCRGPRRRHLLDHGPLTTLGGPRFGNLHF